MLPLQDLVQNPNGEREREGEGGREERCVRREEGEERRGGEGMNRTA
jgi:hypothetical protein